MIAAVDTSVLVAGVLARHEHHLPSRDELERLAASEPAPHLPLHALFESYAVLTRLPAPHRIAPRQARTLLHGSFASWRLAAAPGDVWGFLEEAANAAIAGGTLYEALIVESALSAGARALVTWNIAHFERVARGRLVVRAPRG